MSCTRFALLCFSLPSRFALVWPREDHTRCKKIIFCIQSITYSMLIIYQEKTPTQSNITKSSVKSESKKNNNR
jgi:hypothetical protein